MVELREALKLDKGWYCRYLGTERIPHEPSCAGVPKPPRVQRNEHLSQEHLPPQRLRVPHRSLEGTCGQQLPGDGALQHREDERRGEERRGEERRVSHIHISSTS